MQAVRAEVKALRGDVTRLSIQPVPRDGVSPDPDKIAETVRAKIPTPKDGPPGVDGISPDPLAIVADVLAQIPTPENGSPGRPGADGISPDPDKIAAQIRAQIPEAKSGDNGAPGVSVTDVKLEKGNLLVVFLDGVRKVVGRIEVPKPAAGPFTPGGGGGFSAAAKKGLKVPNEVSPTEDYTIEYGIDVIYVTIEINIDWPPVAGFDKFVRVVCVSADATFTGDIATGGQTETIATLYSPRPGGWIPV